jgi:hypothetical protein
MMMMPQDLLALGGAVVTTLAWRPFLDPINIHELWWALLVPMALGVSVVYKAVRVKTMDHYWREVVIMTAQIVLAMIMLGAAVYVFIEFYVSWIAEYAA